MAIITPYDNKIGVWMVYGGAVGEQSIDDIAHTLQTYSPAVNAVWMKTTNGSDWMGKFDTKPDIAINGPADIDRWVDTLQKYGLEFHAWCVPRGLDINAEANVIIQACQRPGVRSMILDVEPYPDFYQGGQASIRQLMLKIRAALPGSFHIGMSVDGRQAHYGEIFPQEWYPFVNSIHPQVYWVDYQETPEAALADAYKAWGNYGRPIFPVLDGWQPPVAQMDTARTTAVNTYKATGLSWWAFGNIDATHFVGVNHTLQGVVSVPPPDAGLLPAVPGTPIVVNVGGPGYQDGVYPGFTGFGGTYSSANGGTGKYRGVDQRVANVWTSYDPKIKQAGWYKIEAFVPNQHATTGNARYKIHGIKDHPGEWLVSASQSGINNDWMHLGTFQIDPTQPQPGVVFLNDWTFELNCEIAFDAIRWTPVSTLGTKPIMVDVPYRSQEASDARRYANDCGPACVAMYIDWVQKIKGQPAHPVTINQLASETTLAQKDTGIPTSAMVPLAAAHGVTLRFTNQTSLQEILNEVAAGRPPVCLISYAPLTGRENQRDLDTHFVIVTGFDTTNVYLYDPDWYNNGAGIPADAGHNWKVPITQFEQGLNQAALPNEACFVVI